MKVRIGHSITRYVKRRSRRNPEDQKTRTSQSECKIVIEKRPEDRPTSKYFRWRPYRKLQEKGTNSLRRRASRPLKKGGKEKEKKKKIKKEASMDTKVTLKVPVLDKSIRTG